MHRRHGRGLHRPSTTSSGHNFYQRAYKDQPVLFRDSANDGFHEAIGDTIALSVTPEYLVKIGLLDKAPDASRDIGLLMQQALEKIAFLPFGLLIDQWRWKVFSGEVTPANYNKAWWELRLKYQGVAPPAPRGEEFFDPGAKYHVPGNTPYTRYFLAHILQFQFHRALSQAAGCTAPLHRCSIYESKEAGRAAERDAGDGPVTPVAGSARGADRDRSRWTRRRSSTTSRRCRRGWMSKSKESRSVGSHRLTPICLVTEPGRRPPRCAPPVPRRPCPSTSRCRSCHPSTQRGRWRGRGRRSCKW